MRDILITAMVFGALPFVLRWPWVGILLWSWIGYMNPHRLSYGFAYSFPFAMVIAVVTIGAWLMSKERKTIPVTPLTILVIMLTLWVTFTLMFALSGGDYPFAQWDKTMKILLMTFITLAMMESRQRLDMLVWVIVLSLGFFGVKGGIFTILNGGSYKVWGPAGSFIEDNNQLAVAMIMIVPLARYLQMQATHRIVRMGLLAIQILTIFSILGTFSRGALLGLGALMFSFWLLSKRKILIGIGGTIVMVGALSFMPPKWWDRMNTIESYEEDGSAQGRLHQWAFAIEIANNRIVGGGFGVFGDQSIYDRYMTDGALARAAHSAYFQVLGEHGWIGLLLFLMIMAGAIKTCGWVKKRTKTEPDLKWMYDMATMIQCGIVGFSVGGAFVNLAFFDLYWHMIGIVILLKVIAAKELARSPEERAATVRPATGPLGLLTPAFQIAGAGGAGRRT